MNRAYSILTIKRADDGSRVIEGIATTPTPDRMSDVVEPLGVSFKNPSPLLWQHDSTKPVGTVTFGKPTADGVSFKARIESIAEPGALKDRLDEAWQSVKLGLVRGVSIGFRALERSLMKDGGVRFLKSEVLELSLVTIPANAEATIHTIKQAATGRTSKPAPGATGHHPKTGDKTVKTFAQKIADLEAELGPKRSRMKGIMEAALEDGDRELNESEGEEFDGLTEEVKEIDGKLRRLKALDASASTAKAVTDGDRPRIIVPAEPKSPVEKGIGFARMAMCVARAKGDHFRAVDIAKSVYPRERDLHAVLKAQVPGATTTDPTWASPLVFQDNLVSEFVEFLRPMTIVGRFGSGSIPSLRRVPFNVSIPAQISGGAGYWVGEGKPKPLTKFDFSRITLRWTKVANIAVLTEDLLRFSTPSAELMVRNALAEALVDRLDSDFANPAVAEVADVSPASITNGATTTAASGPTADDVRADIQTAVTHFIANNISMVGMVILMRSSQALALTLMRNALGQREFPEMSMSGGSLEGIPVLASQYMPAGVVAFVSADNIYLADDGGVSIDLSREASLEMADSALTMDVNNGASPPVSVETTVVSMFQTNSVAIRAERFINWKRRRSAAVYYFTATSWGSTASPPAPI